MTWDGHLCAQTQLEEAIDDQPSSAAGTWAWRFGWCRQAVALLGGVVWGSGRKQKTQCLCWAEALKKTPFIRVGYSTMKITKRLSQQPIERSECICCSPAPIKDGSAITRTQNGKRIVYIVPVYLFIYFSLPFIDLCVHSTLHPAIHPPIQSPYATCVSTYQSVGR